MYTVIRYSSNIIYYPVAIRSWNVNIWDGLSTATKRDHYWFLKMSEWCNEWIFGDNLNSFEIIPSCFRGSCYSYQIVTLPFLVLWCYSTQKPESNQYALSMCGCHRFTGKAQPPKLHSFIHSHARIWLAGWMRIGKKSKRNFINCVSHINREKEFFISHHYHIVAARHTIIIPQPNRAEHSDGRPSVGARLEISCTQLIIYFGRKHKPNSD